LQDLHAEMLTSGMIFVHGRDMYHRPIVIFRPLLSNKLGYSAHIDEMVTTLAFVLFYVNAHMSAPGKIENHLTIIDLEKAKPWELPIKCLKAF
jgi:hypothetical protein